MNDDVRYLAAAIGAYFLGAVFLGGLIAAGLVYDSKAVVIGALVSAACGYGVQIVSGLDGSVKATIALWAASVIAAAFAALSLIGV